MPRPDADAGPHRLPGPAGRQTARQHGGHHRPHVSFLALFVRPAERPHPARRPAPFADRFCETRERGDATGSTIRWRRARAGVRGRLLKVAIGAPALRVVPAALPLTRPVLGRPRSRGRPPYAPCGRQPHLVCPPWWTARSDPRPPRPLGASWPAPRGEPAAGLTLPAAVCRIALAPRYGRRADSAGLRVPGLSRRATRSPSTAPGPLRPAARPAAHQAADVPRLRWSRFVSCIDSAAPARLVHVRFMRFTPALP